MKKTTDLGKDKVPLLVLKLAVPSMIAQFVNVLYSTVDRMFIGNIPRIGDEALAGVGVCGPIVTLLTSFGTLIGLGGSILMAMRMGAGRKKQAENILAHSFVLLVLFSALLTFFFLLIKGHLLNWFGASDTTFPYADSYMTIYTAGTFFALMAVGLNYFITCQISYECSRSGYRHSDRPVCILCLCIPFSHREKDPCKDHTSEEKEFLSYDRPADTGTGSFSLPDPGHGQRDPYRTEYGTSDLWRTRGRRSPDHLRYYCAELHDADHRSHAGDFQRNTGNLKLQLRCQKH